MGGHIVTRQGRFGRSVQPRQSSVGAQRPTASNRDNPRLAERRSRIGSHAAVANAVSDALAPLGVRLTRTPLGPNDIFELVQAAGELPA